MHEAASAFAGWSDFYVILGSASAALVGLTFIVITLVAADEAQTSSDGVSMFSSPTVAHFGTVLFVSAVATAPWPALAAPAALIAVSGAYGMFYIARISVKALGFTEYRLQADDWLWYTFVPFAGYLGLAVAAALLVAAVEPGRYLLGAAGLILIFAGIHNAWDVVTYLATQRKRDRESKPS